MKVFVTICPECNGETLPHCAKWWCGWSRCPKCAVIYGNGREAPDVEELERRKKNP